jgi:hypothetical protein
MSAENPKSPRLVYEVPCQLLEATVFVMSEGLTLQQRAALPMGNLVRDEAVHGSAKVDLSNSRQQVPNGNASQFDTINY